MSCTCRGTRLKLSTMWGVAMRTLLLIMFEVLALFGIPRMIYELRATLGETAPPSLMAATAAKEQQPAPSVPAKVAQVDELAKGKLLQDSLPPSARTVANLHAVPQLLITAMKSPAAENAAAARDDDYLPPSMRGAGKTKHEARSGPTEVASIRAPVAARAAVPVKQIRHKRHRSERGREAYAASPRRAWSRRVSFLGY